MTQADYAAPIGSALSSRRRPVPAASSLVILPLPIPPGVPLTVLKLN